MTRHSGLHGCFSIGIIPDVSVSCQSLHGALTDHRGRCLCGRVDEVGDGRAPSEADWTLAQGGTGRSRSVLIALTHKLTGHAEINIWLVNRF